MEGIIMLSRTLCEVLEEMRKCYETRNFSPIHGLIEEAQIMANRMEAALSDQRDHFEWQDEVKKEKEELERLLEQGNALRKEVGEEEKKVYRL